MTRLRLNKFLAQATELSRRAADRAIASGTVRVNGAAVTQLGTTIDPRTARVEWGGRRLRAAAAPTYLAFYKPRHVLVTKHDPRGRPTIWRWLAPYRAECNAAGRLDFASEGLLLITNDGALLERLTHPRHGVAKTYHVKVQGIPDAAAYAKLAAGMTIAGVAYRPVQVRPLRRTAHNGWLEMILREGKYRELRTLCAAVGHPVLKLKRIAVGPCTLGSLTPGRARRLTPREIALLKK